ncbi:unnamed protein product [marine sediment metagenome]|uniref:Uncharacterized protein n=1 Tax=marine sediment metagenome TaxID=412755 RepID=X1TN68_9ZZZZ
MKDIHVKFAGVEKASDGQFSIIYIPDQHQILNPGQEYRIVLDGLTYEESKPKGSEFQHGPERIRDQQVR